MDGITEFLRRLATSGAGRGAGQVAGDAALGVGRNAGALAGIDANAAGARRWLEGQQALAGLDEAQRYPGPAAPVPFEDAWMMQDGSMTAGGLGGGSVPGYDAAANMAYGGSPDGATAYENVGDNGMIDPRESMLLSTPLGRKQLRDGWQPGPDQRAAHMALLREVLSRG